MSARASPNVARSALRVRRNARLRRLFCATPLVDTTKPTSLSVLLLLSPPVTVIGPNALKPGDCCFGTAASVLTGAGKAGAATIFEVDSGTCICGTGAPAGGLPGAAGVGKDSSGGDGGGGERRHGELFPGESGRRGGDDGADSKDPNAERSGGGCDPGSDGRSGSLRGGTDGGGVRRGGGKLSAPELSSTSGNGLVAEVAIAPEVGTERKRSARLSCKERATRTEVGVTSVTVPRRVVGRWKGWPRETTTRSPVRRLRGARARMDVGCGVGGVGIKP